MAGPQAAGAGAAAALLLREQAAPVFALYRRILRLHARRLPPPMAAMAGPYVRGEFRGHLSGSTTPAQWGTFLGEWRRYCELLGGEGNDLASAPAPAPAAPAAAAMGAEAGGGGRCDSGEAQQPQPAAAAGGERAEQRPAAVVVGAVAAAPGGAGGLEEELIAHLTQEQRVRLQALKVEALKYGRALLTPEGGQHPPGSST